MIQNIFISDFESDLGFADELLSQNDSSSLCLLLEHSKVGSVDHRSIHDHIGVIYTLKSFHFYDLEFSGRVNRKAIELASLITDSWLPVESAILRNTIMESIRLHLVSRHYEALFFFEFAKQGGQIYIGGSSGFRDKIDVFLSRLGISYKALVQSDTGMPLTVDVVNSIGDVNTFRPVGVERFIEKVLLAVDKHRERLTPAGNVGLVVGSSLKTCVSSARELVSLFKEIGVEYSVFHTTTDDKSTAIGDGSEKEYYMSSELFSLVKRVSTKHMAEVTFERSVYKGEDPLLSLLLEEFSTFDGIRVPLIRGIDAYCQAECYVSDGNFQKIVMVPGRGYSHVAFSDCCRAYSISTVSVQNAFFGPFYTYTPMAGDKALLSDRVALDYQQGVKYYQPSPKVRLVGNPRYDLTNIDYTPRNYINDKPINIIILGQVGLEASFCQLILDVYAALRSSKVECDRIIYKPHPRQTSEDLIFIENVISKSNFEFKGFKISSDDHTHWDLDNIIAFGISTNYIIELSLVGFVVVPVSYLPGYMIDFQSLGCQRICCSSFDIEDLFKEIRSSGYSRLIRESSNFRNINRDLNSREFAFSRIKEEIELC